MVRTALAVGGLFVICAFVVFIATREGVEL